MKKLMTWFQTMFRKRLAYRTVFTPQDEAQSAAAKIVLADLKKLCPNNPARGTGTPIDEKQVFINIGRIDVLNHIMGMINLSDEKLNEIAREEEQYGN
jgi:hypothetical protein